MKPFVTFFLFITFTAFANPVQAPDVRMGTFADELQNMSGWAEYYSEQFPTPGSAFFAGRASAFRQAASRARDLAQD